MIPASGQRQALTLTRCTVSQSGSIMVDRGVNYALQINPSEFSHHRNIRYNNKRVVGQIGSPMRFSGIDPDDISFTATFDGTGVVPIGPGQPIEVADQIEALNRVIYTYRGEAHEPNHVQILWGTMVFYGRLCSIGLQYTLFKPSGAPLRASAEMDFVGFLSAPEAERLANRSSPDLSHSVEVREGDTLPLLCHRIYGDSRYYPEVARFNGLREFRRLQPGLRLHFPPLA